MGNFIRSVLSSARAILQQKTVTPTTSQQIVGPDSGYDGLSQVTVNPIPSQYVIPTAITPSNSSPAYMASGNAYKPSANGYAVDSVNSITPSNSSPVLMAGASIVKPSESGYAIKSYNSKTPSNSSPASLTSGEICKLGGAGYAIASYESKTPSNSSPAALSNGGIYKMGGAGYAIASYESKAPSNSSPAALSNGGIYKMGGAGYAISSYANITPTADGAYFASGMVKMASSGYAYSSKPSLSETVLWTNSSPSTNFGAQTLTLSDNMSNYDYIKVYFAAKTTMQTAIKSTIIPVSEFTELTDASSASAGGNFTRAVSPSTRNGSMFRVRTFWYISDTQIRFESTSGLSQSGTDNSNIIPIKITGIK